MDFDKGYAVNFDGMLQHPRGDPRPDGLSPEGDLRLVDRGLRRAVPGDDPRRLLPDAADELRHPEGDGRAAARRLFAHAASSTASASACRRSASGRALPNKAASGFFSNILREPLVGKEAILPVGEDVRHWHASPRAAVGFFRHAMTLDTARARAAAEPGDAGPLGDGRRADRGAAPGGGRRGGRADPPRARPDDRGHRRRLGDALRRRAGRWRSASPPTPRSTRSSPPTSPTSSAAGSAARRQRR